MCNFLLIEKGPGQDMSNDITTDEMEKQDLVKHLMDFEYGSIQRTADK